MAPPHWKTSTASSESLLASKYPEYREGNKIAIFYDPTAPKKSVLKSGFHTGNLAVILVPITLCSIGCLTIVSALST